MLIPPELAELSNAEIARRLNCSRQYVFLARRRAAGLCERCAQPVTINGAQHCAIHQRFKAWQPGGRGRPPVGRQANDNPET